MVNKLRRQFVIVTTSLMIITFGGFLIINTLYSKYWNDMEMSGMLDWIAHSGIFLSSEDAVDKNEMVLNLLDDERPIIGIVLDSDENIVSTQVIGANSLISEDFSVEKSVIERMCKEGSSEYKIGRYYYSYSKMDDKTLLVIMDDRFHGSLILWWIGIIALISLGITALLGITFFLSGFVTRPAEQSLLREKRFISDASHELKTPLGAISINAQALECDNKDNLYIKNIITESERMSRLIEKLLTLSKFDETEETAYEVLSLSDICDEMALTYESVSFENNIVFDYDIEPGLVIRGNGDELRQLLVILIDNAIKNVNDAGRVSFECFAEKNHKYISVANTGRGIRQDDLVHIFDRFYTTDKSRKNGSFGLGLAIARAIADRHGAEISVESEPDKITEFTVTF